MEDKNYITRIKRLNSALPIARHEAPWPRPGCVTGYAGGSQPYLLLTGVGDLRILMQGRERDTRFVDGAGMPVLTSAADRHQSIMDVDA